MDNLRPTTLRKLKSQAALLLKDLRATSPDSLHTADRFLQIPFFFNHTAGWIIDHVDAVQLKHSFQVIAAEHGFKTWTALKQAVIGHDCLYRSNSVAFIHSWFNDYAQAEIYLNKHGGYLICFWKDFAVCGKEYIARIGLGQYEEQWKSIGYNWVKPADTKAFLFLKEVAAKNYEAQQ